MRALGRRGAGAQAKGETKKGNGTVPDTLDLAEHGRLAVNGVAVSKAE